MRADHDAMQSGRLAYRLGFEEEPHIAHKTKEFRPEHTRPEEISDDHDPPRLLSLE